MSSFLRFLLLTSLSFSTLSAQLHNNDVVSYVKYDSFILAKSCIDPDVERYFEEKGITSRNSHIKGYGECFNSPIHKVKRKAIKDLKHYLGEECSSPAFINLLKSEGIDPNHYQIESSSRCHHQNIS